MTMRTLSLRSRQQARLSHPLLWKFNHLCNRHKSKHRRHQNTSLSRPLCVQNSLAQLLGPSFRLVTRRYLDLPHADHLRNSHPFPDLGLANQYQRHLPSSLRRFRDIAKTQVRLPYHQHFLEFPGVHHLLGQPLWPLQGVVA